MIPNTQFPLNPAAQQGTGQQVNSWVDHTAQHMPQLQGGPQVMQPLGAPVAQPLAQPGQSGPTPVPPIPAPPQATNPDGRPINVQPNHPEQPHPGGRAFGPYYDPNAADNGRSVYEDALNAWTAGMPRPDLGPGMTHDQRWQAHADQRANQQAYMQTKPQWVLPLSGTDPSRGQNKPDPVNPNRWLGGGGYSG